MKTTSVLSFAVVALGLVACPPPKPASPTVDLARSTVSLDRSASVLANGTDKVTITVSLLDTTGAPVAAQLVQLNVTGSGNGLSSAAVTDASGQTHATLTSTVAETKTVTATVSAGALGQAPSVTFVPAVGTGATLAMKTQPTNAQSGAVIHPAVEVSVEDGAGHLVTTSTASITVSLVGGSGATLSGTKQVSAVNGVAVFTDLSVDKVATGYALSFTASSLTTVVSQTFDVTPGSSSKLGFQTAPTSTASGSPIAPGVAVVVQDANGNVVADPPVSVTLTLVPAGPTLSGTTTQSTVNGVATFSDLTVDRAGTGYALVAQASGYPSASSAKFDVTPGQAAKLAFLVQPSAAASGANLAPAVEVSVQDAAGNRVAQYTSPVAVAFSTSQTAKLSGTLSQTPVNGVASFPDLSVDKAGTYTLSASSGALSSPPSATFQISPGAAARLTYLQPPTNVTAGAAIAPAVVLALQDANGNPVSGNTMVTVALGTNPGNATLAGTLSQPATNGTATFSDLSLDKTGNGYTLSASASGVAAVASGTFNVTAGSGSKLVFTQQAGNAVSGQALSPAVQVTVEDATGNVVTGSSAAITIALGNNPTGAQLGGTTTVNAQNGVALFSSLTVDKSGTGYTLSASSPSIAAVTGTAFNVAPGAASKLVFTAQPQGALNGATLPPVSVTVEDAAGNTVSSGSHTVALALGVNPSGATLSGTTSVPASAGVASFGNLSLNLTGAGYTLVASSAGLASATSATFDITPGLVTGSQIVHYFTDTGQTNVAVDLGGGPIIYVAGGGGFQSYSGSADAGMFWIAGVPTSTYYLQVSPGSYVVTNARTIDLGYDLGGRADVRTAGPVTPDSGTLLNLTLNGLDPWTYDDTLEVFSSNAGLWGQYIEYLAVDGGYPAVGATSLVDTIDYGSIAAPTPLVDASKGDQTFFWQLKGVFPPGDAGVYYQTAQASFETTSLTVQQYQTSTVAGAMTPLNQNQTLNLGWNLPAFEQLDAAINPGATFVEHTFALDAIPSAGHGFYAATPDLITMFVTTPSLPIQSFPISYGNPFTAWTLFGAEVSYAGMPYSVAGINGTVNLDGWVGLYDTAQSFPFANLAPRLSPPVAPLINGQSAFNARIGVGLNPVLSWSAPATGSANAYRVDAIDLSADGSGKLVAAATASIVTAARTVTLPPGFLLPGHHYVFRIQAESRGAYSLATAPYLWDFPMVFGACLTSVMTP